MIPSGISNKLAYITALGLAATSLSIDAAIMDPIEQPFVSQDRAEWTLDQVVVGVKYPFCCELTNNDSKPIKVLGSPGICVNIGCVNPIDPPTIIPPRESRLFRFELVTRYAKPFRITAKIFLESADRHGIIVPLTVTGNALDVSM